ncbi:MAG: aspartate carbamoyltransferase catalytic subunit [Xanthomonadales bacterium]|nr:aspartate carbamoyltransferase catalytic subunit [Xanthomonadales bacterium]
MTDLQHHSNGRLRHLLSLEGLNRVEIEALLDRAEALRPQALDGRAALSALAGQTVVNLFFEPSTRTRSSFQLAARRLGAEVLNFDVAHSSSRKGETLLDTFRNLEAMGADAFVIRVAESGALAELAEAAHPHVHLVNAGDGRAAHPTQGLLDMLTIRQHKGRDFSGLTFLLVGDILHSRVARSDLHALRALGAGEIRICGPHSLLPQDSTLDGCQIFGDLDAAVEGVDVVMMLRLQRERMEEGLISSLTDYHREFGLDARRLRRASPAAIVTHPGPMNRGLEITDEVADGPQSRILEQVSNGVAVRMAVLAALLAPN